MLGAVSTEKVKVSYGNEVEGVVHKWLSLGFPTQNDGFHIGEGTAHYF